VTGGRARPPGAPSWRDPVLIKAGRLGLWLLRLLYIPIGEMTGKNTNFIFRYVIGDLKRVYV